MADFFLCILNMSLVMGIVIILLLLVRPLFRGLPKKSLFVLWGLVLLQFLVPISRVLFDLEDRYYQAVVVNQYETETGRVGIKEENDSYVKAESVFPLHVSFSKNKKENAGKAFSTAQIVWGIGVALFLCYTGISVMLLRKRLRNKVKIQKDIYESSSIEQAFSCGLFRPKVFLPAGMDDIDMEPVIRHELRHIKRGDLIMKAVAYFLVLLHWFNPLSYIAFHFFVKDMELSCDEDVLMSESAHYRSKYAKTLILQSMSKKERKGFLTAHYGNDDIERRVKSIVQYRKPNRVIYALTGALCLTTILLSFYLSVQSPVFTFTKDIGLSTNVISVKNNQSIISVNADTNQINTLFFIREDESNCPTQGKEADIGAGNMVPVFEQTDRYQTKTDNVSQSKSLRYQYRMALNNKDIGVYSYECEYSVLSNGTCFLNTRTQKLYALPEFADSEIEQLALCSGNYSCIADEKVLHLISKDYNEDVGIVHLTTCEDGLVSVWPCK